MVRMPQVTWSAANARRLARSFSGAPTAAEAVRTMLAAQAQVAGAAEISIALRVSGGTCRDVRDAQEDRTLVRAPGLRGTIHTVATSDLGLWTGTFASMPVGRLPSDPAHEPSPAELDRLCTAIGDAVAEADGPLTLGELHEQVLLRAGDWAGDPVMPAFQMMWPRWRLAQAEASRRGLVGYGPGRGRAVTYTAPPRVDSVPPDVARGELLVRYLHAYGPSTPGAYARWHAAPVSWAEETFRSLADEGRITQVTLEGTPAWLCHDDLDFDATPPLGIRLLPHFDALAIAAFPRERFFPGAAFERALARGQAGNYPVVLLDGEVAGVWHQQRSGRRVQVRVEPLFRMTQRRRSQLDDAVEAVAAVQGLRPELTVGEVSTGPHA